MDYYKPLATVVKYSAGDKKANIPIRIRRKVTID